MPEASSSIDPRKQDVIRQYAAAGFPIVPLSGKRPIRVDWPDGIAPGEYGPAEIANQNYGAVLGDRDLVLDVDPRHFRDGDKPLGRLWSECGITRDTLSTFIVRTGSDGLHIYFRKPENHRVASQLAFFPGIEVKSRGRQVVGPYSRHPDTGRAYEIISGSPASIQDAPPSLLAICVRRGPDFASAGDGAGTGKFVSDAGVQARYMAYLQDVAPLSISGQKGDETAFRVACRGRDMGLPPALTWEFMIECWNERCEPPWTPDELKIKVLNAYLYAQNPVGVSHPAADFVDPPPGPPPALADPNAERIRFIIDKFGNVLKNFQNLLAFLRLPGAGLHKIFGFNEFTGQVEFVSPAPWHRGKSPRCVGLYDEDLKLMKGYLATRHKFEASIQAIEEAVTVVAYHERFHPVREYLEKLDWDGTKRLDTWLHDYCGVDNTDEYHCACARKTLCAAVARIFNPGIKFDHVLVLEGAQDIGKSTVVQILGGRWAADAPMDPHCRDTVDMMRGRWIVEMAEMEVARRADEDALKAFITRQTDLVRLAYGRRTGEYPRQCIFIASKNPRADGTYLRDETGNRRWWPVRCNPRHGETQTQMDFAGLKNIRDQLFAEAVHQIKTGEKLYMETLGLKSAAQEAATRRYIAHEWTERIAQWLHEMERVPETQREFLTGRDVWIEAMGGTDRTFDRRSQQAISGIMHDMGWRSGTKRFGRAVIRGYHPPAHIFMERVTRSAVESIL